MDRYVRTITNRHKCTDHKKYEQGPHQLRYIGYIVKWVRIRHGIE